jgi:hemolysin III
MKQTADKPAKRAYTPGEEIASAIVHGLGAALSVAGLVFLIIRTVTLSDARGLVSVCIYGASLIILYTMSTLYHALTPVRAKKVFKVLDHSAIYLLIAGTYTVFTLSVLRNWIGWTVFGVIWGCAAVGITFEAFWVNRPKVVSALLFVAMGWIVIFAIKPLFEALTWSSFVWVLAGGLVYSFGTIVYAIKKLKWSHPLWHLIVLAASVFHYIAVWKAF